MHFTSFSACIHFTLDFKEEDRRASARRVVPLLFVINFAVIYYIQARSSVSPDKLLIYSIFEIKSQC